MLRDRFCLALGTAAALACAAVAGGCGRFGQVEGGRVIQYDRDKGLVTFIPESNGREPGRSPVTVRVPANPDEMGPAPRAGGLLDLDAARKQLLVYDAGVRRLRTIPYTLVAERRDVYRGDPRLHGLPRIDRENRTITVYEPSRRLLLTFSVPDEDFRLPEDTWRAGDDIRYYYKDPGHALRMMNVSQVDLKEARE